MAACPRPPARPDGAVPGWGWGRGPGPSPTFPPSPRHTPPPHVSTHVTKPHAHGFSYSARATVFAMEVVAFIRRKLTPRESHLLPWQNLHGISGHLSSHQAPRLSDDPAHLQHPPGEGAPRKCKPRGTPRLSSDAPLVYIWPRLRYNLSLYQLQSNLILKSEFREVNNCPRRSVYKGGSWDLNPGPWSVCVYYLH